MGQKNHRKRASVETPSWTVTSISKLKEPEPMIFTALFKRILKSCIAVNTGLTLAEVNSQWSGLHSINKIKFSYPRDVINREASYFVKTPRGTVYEIAGSICNPSDAQITRQSTVVVTPTLDVNLRYKFKATWNWTFSGFDVTAEPDDATLGVIPMPQPGDITAQDIKRYIDSNKEFPVGEAVWDCKTIMDKSFEPDIDFSVTPDNPHTVTSDWNTDVEGAISALLKARTRVSKGLEPFPAYNEECSQVLMRQLCKTTPPFVPQPHGTRVPLGLTINTKHVGTLEQGWLPSTPYETRNCKEWNIPEEYKMPAAGKPFPLGWDAKDRLREMGKVKAEKAKAIVKAKAEADAESERLARRKLVLPWAQAGGISYSGAIQAGLAPAPVNLQVKSVVYSTPQPVPASTPTQATREDSGKNAAAAAIPKERPAKRIKPGTFAYYSTAAHVQRSTTKVAPKAAQTAAKAAPASAHLKNAEIKSVVYPATQPVPEPRTASRVPPSKTAANAATRKPAAPNPTIREDTKPAPKAVVSSPGASEKTPVAVTAPKPRPAKLAKPGTFGYYSTIAQLERSKSKPATKGTPKPLPAAHVTAKVAIAPVNSIIETTVTIAKPANNVGPATSTTTASESASSASPKTPDTTATTMPELESPITTRKVPDSTAVALTQGLSAEKGRPLTSPIKPCDSAKFCLQNVGIKLSSDRELVKPEKFVPIMSGALQPWVPTKEDVKAIEAREDRAEIGMVKLGNVKMPEQSKTKKSEKSVTLPKPTLATATKEPVRGTEAKTVAVWKDYQDPAEDKRITVSLPRVEFSFEDESRGAKDSFNLTSAEFTTAPLEPTAALNGQLTLTPGQFSYQVPSPKEPSLEADVTATLNKTPTLAAGPHPADEANVAKKVQGLTDTPKIVLKTRISIDRPGAVLSEKPPTCEEPAGATPAVQGKKSKKVGKKAVSKQKKAARPGDKIPKPEESPTSANTQQASATTKPLEPASDHGAVREAVTTRQKKKAKKLKEAINAEDVIKPQEETMTAVAEQTLGVHRDTELLNAMQPPDTASEVRPGAAPAVAASKPKKAFKPKKMMSKPKEDIAEAKKKIPLEMQKASIVLQAFLHITTAPEGSNCPVTIKDWIEYTAPRVAEYTAAKEAKATNAFKLKKLSASSRIKKGVAKIPEKSSEANTELDVLRTNIGTTADIPDEPLLPSESSSATMVNSCTAMALYSRTPVTLRILDVAPILPAAIFVPVNGCSALIRHPKVSGALRAVAAGVNTALPVGGDTETDDDGLAAVDWDAENPLFSLERVHSSTSTFSRVVDAETTESRWEEAQCRRYSESYITHQRFGVVFPLSVNKEEQLAEDEDNHPDNVQSRAASLASSIDSSSTSNTVPPEPSTPLFPPGMTYDFDETPIEIVPIRNGGPALQPSKQAQSTPDSLLDGRSYSHFPPPGSRSLSGCSFVSEASPSPGGSAELALLPELYPVRVRSRVPDSSSRIPGGKIQRQGVVQQPARSASDELRQAAIERSFAGDDFETAINSTGLRRENGEDGLGYPLKRVGSQWDVPATAESAKAVEGSSPFIPNPPKDRAAEHRIADLGTKAGDFVTIPLTPPKTKVVQFGPSITPTFSNFDFAADIQQQHAERQGNPLGTAQVFSPASRDIAAAISTDMDAALSGHVGKASMSEKKWLAAEAKIQAAENGGEAEPAREQRLVEELRIFEKVKNIAKMESWAEGDIFKAIKALAAEVSSITVTEEDVATQTELASSPITEGSALKLSSIQPVAIYEPSLPTEDFTPDLSPSGICATPSVKPANLEATFIKPTPAQAHVIKAVLEADRVAARGGEGEAQAGWSVVRIVAVPVGGATSLT